MSGLFIGTIKGVVIQDFKDLSAGTQHNLLLPFLRYRAELNVT